VKPYRSRSGPPILLSLPLDNSSPIPRPPNKSHPKHRPTLTPEYGFLCFRKISSLSDWRDWFTTALVRRAHLTSVRVGGRHANSRRTSLFSSGPGRTAAECRHRSGRRPYQRYSSRCGLKWLESRSLDRCMSVPGQSRHYDRAPMTSGSPQ
jgi:hypothetical protein